MTPVEKILSGMTVGSMFERTQNREAFLSCDADVAIYASTDLDAKIDDDNEFAEWLKGINGNAFTFFRETAIPAAFDRFGVGKHIGRVLTPKTGQEQHEVLRHEVKRPAHKSLKVKGLVIETKPVLFRESQVKPAVAKPKATRVEAKPEAKKPSRRARNLKPAHSGKPQAPRSVLNAVRDFKRSIEPKTQAKSA